MFFHWAHLSLVKPQDLELLSAIVISVERLWPRSQRQFKGLNAKGNPCFVIHFFDLQKFPLSYLAVSKINGTYIFTFSFSQRLKCFPLDVSGSPTCDFS